MYKTKQKSYAPNIGAASTQVTGPNKGRIAVFVSSDAATSIMVSFGEPADGATGIILRPNTQALKLLYDEIGESIRETIYAMGFAATSIFVTEFYEE